MTIALSREIVGKVAQDILRRHGGALLAPSVTTCYSDTLGTTPATRDGTIGRINCALGSAIFATQTTAGLQPRLRQGAKNLLTYSADFSNAAWTKIKGGTGSTPTATSGFTDPDGGSTAWRILANSGASATGADYSVVRQVAALTPNASRSIFAKSNTGASHAIYFGTPTTGSVITATTEWQRFQIQRTAANANFDIGAFPSASNSGASCDILVWKPQFEAGLFMRDYAATVAAQTSNGVGNYWIDTDAIDDVIGIAGTELIGATSATLVYSVRAVGQTTLQAQNISAGLNISQDNMAALMIVPDDTTLLASELAMLKRYAIQLSRGM